MMQRLPVVALAILILALQIFPLYANDTWMHLLLGRDLLQDGIPRHEAYSYTAAGQPFVYHEWLAGVLLHVLHEIGGADALVVLQPLCALLIAGCLYPVARSRGADRTVTLLVLGAGIYVASFRLFLRPHLLVLPLLALSLLLLGRWRARGGWRLPAALVAVQVLWTNLHGSFPEGIVLATLFAAGEALRRGIARGPEGAQPAVPGWQLAALPAALTAASLLNPYGVELLELTLAHSVDPLFRERIFEYAPLLSERFRTTRMFPLVLAWLAAVAAGMWAGRRNLDPAHLLPVAGFLALSIWMNRAVPELVIVTVPLTAAGLSGPLTRLLRGGRAAAVSLLLVAGAGSVLVFGYRLDERAVRRFGLGVDPFTPVAATDALERAGVGGNVFCSFPYGSYLAYRLAPDVRIAFDSRTIPYGPDLYRDYLAARRSAAAFRRHEERFGVDAAVLSFKVDGAEDLHRYLNDARDWGLIYFDLEAVVYVRRSPATADLLARERIRCANPVLFDRRGIPQELAEACREECGRLLARHPESVLPRFFLAVALDVLGDPDRALEETGAILERRRDLPFVHRFRAGLLRARGELDAAAREEAAARRLEP